MTDEHLGRLDDASAPRAGKRPAMTKRLWRKVRVPLANSTFVLDGIAMVIGAALRFIYATNRTVKGSHDPGSAFDTHAPGIAAFWHGQHILAPCLKPKGAEMAALFSRSRDAELNARVAERFGFEIVRGSGGRDRARTLEKGGVRALLALKKALDGGKAVAMIADIPHGTPREAGLGIVMLGRISGRPVVPVALATSRRKVIESSWDKTTINLPFGRKAVVLGDPIHVPADADDAELERKRREITAGLNAVTAEAYRLVSARQ